MKSSKLNYDGAGSGGGIPASGDAKNAMKVANLSSMPAKMGKPSNMYEVGIPAQGGMSSVPSAASAGNTFSNKNQAAYYSERGDASAGDIEQGKAGDCKGYYGDRDGR